jgi:hypothetical protein
MSYVREFGRAVLGDWVARMTGPASLALLLLGVAFAALGWAVPAWCVVAAGVVCLLVSGYSVWLKERLGRENAEGRLKPLLEIRGIGPVQPAWYQGWTVSTTVRTIMVRNLTPQSLRFVAKIVEMRPNAGLRVPVCLQPLSSEAQKEIEVHGGGAVSVDLYEERGQFIRLKLMNGEPWHFDLPADARHELRVCVDVVGGGSVSVFRWFYIVPQRDGPPVLTPDGSHELA